MKGKLFPFFFLFLILFSISISADKPTQLCEDCLTIAYPKIDTFEYGVDLDFHYHVFDKNLFPVDNTTVDCIIHLYNTEGHHIIEAPLVFNGNNIDYEIELNASTFPYMGEYSVIVQCDNGNDDAGYVSYPVNVGIDEEDEEYPSIIFIIIVLVLSFIFLALLIMQEQALFGIISGVLFLICGFLFYTIPITGIPTMFTNGIGVICWAVSLLLLATSYKLNKGND